MFIQVGPVMGIITTKSTWLRAAAGLVCRPRKWISLGKQTQGAFSYHKPKLHTENIILYLFIIMRGFLSSRSRSLHASDTALMWTTGEFCSDTTDGPQRAVDGQILRELQREEREMRTREPTNSTDCKKSKVGCSLFLSLNP